MFLNYLIQLKQTVLTMRVKNTLNRLHNIFCWKKKGLLLTFLNSHIFSSISHAYPKLVPNIAYVKF